MWRTNRRSIRNKDETEGVLSLHNDVRRSFTRTFFLSTAVFAALFAPSAPNKSSQQGSLSNRPSEPQVKENEFDASKVSETNIQIVMENQLLGGSKHTLEKEVINGKGVTIHEI
ncbi:hypothetical protein MTR_2g040490 [Medicago truncatula]|uniref:Uncharacterized protein n=1 Tax=Medicago truncatula TaxID=3880 RepID=A0A072V629_MEDTR|nr:hypothetical protein MTR_2g040490 [Medicago truncatula]